MSWLISSLFQKLKADYEKTITPFNENLSAQRTPIIQINASYDMSELRDTIKKAGNADIKSIHSEYELSLLGENDSAVMATASRGRYVPGYAAEAGVGIRVPEMPTGDTEVYFGYLDFEFETQDIKDGAVFGVDSEGTFIAIYQDGAQTDKIYKKDWNINPSFDLDLSKGFILQILFVYYGYGPIWFRVVDPISERVVDLHKYLKDGEPSIANSNLQVGAKVSQETNDTEFKMYLSGRQFAVIGTPVFKVRTVSHLREDVNIPTENYVPVMSFRRQVGQKAVPVQIQEIETLTDNDVVVQWRVGADLSREEDQDPLEWITPSGHDEDEVALEVNTNADTIDMNTGIKVDEDIVLGGGGPQAKQFEEDQTASDIPDEYIVTLCARSIDGGAATATFIGKMVEER